MRVRSRESGWRYLLQPWRYDFEYARDWRDLSFPLYGLSLDQGVTRRMGNKSRALRSRSGPARFVPEEWGARLVQLEVVEGGDGWQVRICSQGPLPGVPAQRGHHMEGASFGRRFVDGDGRARSCEIQVDNEVCLFEGWQRNQVWAGQTVLADVALSLVVDCADPESLALSRITDPAPYLRGQREFMKRQS